MLQLSLFGPFSLQQDGREIRVKSLKLRAILGYLALSEQLVETRERLVGLFWSESGEAQARGVLRQLIRELREVFGEAGRDALRINAHEIGFERNAVDLDVWAVIRAAEAQQVHPLLLERQHIADDLLVGLEDLDPSFRGWLLVKRHLLSDRLLRALEIALDRVDHPGTQAQLAEAILNLDPTHEKACRRLMLASATSGRTAHALRTYKALWNLLDQDFGIEPSKATQDLAADIKLGLHERGTQARDEAASAACPPGGALKAPPSKSPETPPGPPTPSSQPQTRLLLSLQAVDTRQIQSDLVHLVVGFRQFLIASLVKFREWHVTDVPFQMRTGGTPPNGDERYEIQILASQKGDVLLLTLTLKALATGFYVWSEGFELSLANWLDAQHRVIRRVAAALNVHLSAERLRRLSGRTDIRIGVYDRWLRCQTLVRTFDPQHWNRLAAQLNEIIEAAPDFVPAYCSLADLHSYEHIAHPGILRNHAREQRAMQLARKAVELDAAHAGARRTLAWAHAMMKQHGQAELHIQIANELNPHDSSTAVSAALLLAFCGQHRRASELSQGVLDVTVSPSPIHWALQADIQFLIGNYEAAAEAGDRANDVSWGVAAWRTASLSHLGRTAEATAEGARFITRVRANWFGSVPATDHAITHWFLHAHPIRHHADWSRLRDGLQAAGLPVEGCEFNALNEAGPDVTGRS